MGLEIAEILMDLEDEFCIFVDVEEGGKMGTLVGDFEDMVVRHYDRERLATLVIEISGIDDLDKDPRYVKIQSENKWLPSPGFKYLHVFPRKLDKDKIILKVQRAITLFSDELIIRSRVREIITDRLSLKVPAKSDQDLVKDLHCG